MGDIRPGAIGCAAIVLAALLLASCKPAPAPTKAYAYPAWGFKASFPSAPSETPKPASPDGSAPASDLIETNDGRRDFAVWAADISGTNMTLDELAASAADHVSQGTGATASTPTYAATGEGVMGREYQLTQGGKWFATMRVFQAGGRFYEVVARSAIGQDDAAVQDFLVSFHTLGAAPAANAAS